MIEISNLTQQFGATTAVNQLNLTIPNGLIFGFLGHNGAGKSTTIKNLVSILEPTTGDIFVDGDNLKEHRFAIKKKIAYVPDTPDLFLHLSANEYWDLISVAYDIPHDRRQERQSELVHLFEMQSHQDDVLESFSHGMRQKVLVIGALLPDPDIWILDEPLQGLDPQSAFDLKEMMKVHAQKGKTVIFSTHNLDTAQQLCDELAILKKGELLYNGTVADLLHAHPGQSLETIYLKLTGSHAKPIDTEANNE